MTRTAAHSALDTLAAAMADFAHSDVQSALRDCFVDDALCHICHPFGDVIGPDALFDTAYGPLMTAFADLERRALITLCGADDSGAQWIGAMGHYVGTFSAPFLDIPPTGHLAHMRYHEFYRIAHNQVVEMQAIWDIPELMMQAHAWPMGPSLGRAGITFGPMSQDGLAPKDDKNTQNSRTVVMDMLTQLIRHPREGGPEVMQLQTYWHPLLNWYGPAGIGTARGIAGFRNWHQIPFLNAMPDRGDVPFDLLDMHFFAQGNYVAVTGWPNMQMTLTGDGWLGIAPSGQKITMRSLDFWRVEGQKIRENWVLLDLLDIYRQLGVDVLARMRAFNQARPSGAVPIAHGVV